MMPLSMKKAFITSHNSFIPAHENVIKSLFSNTFFHSLRLNNLFKILRNLIYFFTYADSTFPKDVAEQQYIFYATKANTV